jgi:predicted RNA-binding protein with PIN domain
MIRYKRSKPHDITIVFDGHKTGRGNESAAVRGGVAVIYSGLGERADDVIKRVITRDRREWIVVTSDKDIVHHAWSVNSIPVPSDEFAGIVIKETGVKSALQEDGYHTDMLMESGEGKDLDEDDENSRAWQGNPHKLSKREKSVRRALNKL